LIRTLYAKLALALLVVLGLIGVTHVFLTLFATSRHIQEVNQKLNQSLAEHLVNEKILMRDGEVDEEALEDLFHMLMVINPTIELYLLDPQGEILAYSAPPGEVKMERVSLEPIRTFLAGKQTLPILGDSPRDPEKQKIFSVYPIPLNASATLRKTAVTGSVDERATAPPHQGYLYIVLASEEYDSVVEMLQGSYILRLSMGIAAGSLVCGVMGGLYVFNLLTRRLRRLARSMDRFKQNPSVDALALLEHPARARGGDEIDQLALSFEEMAARITEQMSALEQKDELRRVLVANISHDLRTPLATLHGYLETLLLKEGQLSPEEQKQYLKIATKHSDRLGNLVSELFELSKLDSRETELHVEPFSLPELVQDVVQELQLIAREKQVELGANFGKNLPFVRADISLVERVLQNLIENAIRHTPARGSVTVSLAPEEDSIRVRVEDTGGGISEAELPHIFDRFYRGRDNGSNDSSQGAGLGLAITKRILELHGSSIEVASRLHQGTAFTFCLPSIPSETV
jgi:two-component system OmpR family sensor kinase